MYPETIISQRSASGASSHTAPFRTSMISLFTKAGCVLHSNSGILKMRCEKPVLRRVDSQDLGFVGFEKQALYSAMVGEPSRKLRSK